MYGSAIRISSGLISKHVLQMIGAAASVPLVGALLSDQAFAQVISKSQIPSLVSEAVRLELSDEPRACRTLCTRIIETDPHCGMAYLERGRSAAVLRDNEAALKDFLMAAKNGVAIKATDERCGLLRGLKRYKEALAFADEMIKANPKDPHFLIIKAKIERDMSDYRAMRVTMERAVPLDPSSYNMHYMLALAHLKLKEYPQALASINRAMQLREGMHNTRCYALRADVYEAMGRNDLALADRKRSSADDDFGFENAPFATKLDN